MHETTAKHLGDGLRKEYRLPNDLPEAMRVLLKRLGDRQALEQRGPARGEPGPSRSSDCRACPASRHGTDHGVDGDLLHDRRLFRAVFAPRLPQYLRG